VLRFWNLFFLIISIFLAFGMLWNIFQYVPKGFPIIYFLQTTDGDAILITSPHGQEIMIDGGIDMSVLSSLSKVRPFWDNTIEMLIITHPDADHYYGAVEILKRYKVKTLVVSGVVKDDPKYAELYSLAQQKNSEVIIANSSTDLLVDGLLFDILRPENFIYGSREHNGNNDSIIIRFSYKEYSILLTGDIEASTEYELLKSGIDIQSQMLKVPHHGSRSSSSIGFIKAVNPKTVIITAGTENRFGHPHEDIVQRYLDLGVEVRSTKTEGTIRVEWR